MRLQNLDIKPTLQNMEILVQTLYDLRSVYNELKKNDEMSKLKGGGTDDPKAGTE